ncbi:DUF3011 domain-containing protein [Lysobacter enzymogenes]|uniref:DUF3011 domain-containing protein n=1 Tax=Lysobacter enzymogenes TaxID=69 RepID=A0A3N2REY6_LYSEN|nr:DUF3011 domain-containing protein [Lysobacter enzymogenes]ROU06001.1 DUF3011 domain-containing protein [Lysobacter enzymogenes]
MGSLKAAIRLCALTAAAGAGAAFAVPATAEPAGERLYGGNLLRCASEGEDTVRCPADTRGGVRLVRRTSGKPCVEGTSWGADRGGVWVAQGCAADFLLGRGGSGGDSTRGARVIKCESLGGRWNHCPARSEDGVALAQQLSKQPCLRNQTWGTDRSGVWVAGGCRGEFRLLGAQPEDEPAASAAADDGRKLIKCESLDRRARRCDGDTGSGVRMVKQLSKTECVEGRSWGFDAHGVWVEGGCRAEFELDYRGNGGG